MQKLTQTEAQDLIKKAWECVADNTLGSYRFGKVLHNLLPYDPKSPCVEGTPADFLL